MATIKDVAREAGLSVGTVSRVLNNRGYISDQTRERVAAAMEKLHYQPNEMARALSRQDSHMIGVILPAIEHPYFSRVLSCIEASARSLGYRILPFSSEGSGRRQEEYIQICQSNRVCGLILCTGSVKARLFHGLGFPTVAFERLLDEANAGIECDNLMGGRLAAEHMIGKGCRHLLCLRGAADVSMPAEQRQVGFEQVCREQDISFRTAILGSGYPVDYDYRQEIREAMDVDPSFDAVFADSDVIAAQIVQVLTERGIRIPDEVRVIGYDDVLPARLTTPALTTIHQPVQEMAEATMSILDSLIHGEVVPERTVFPVTLVERGSA